MTPVKAKTLSAIIVVGLLAGGVWLVSLTSSSGDYPIHPQLHDVLGDYNAMVENGTGQEASITCTVRALSNGQTIGTDTFTVTIPAHGYVLHDGKAAIAGDAADDYAGSCTGP